MKSLYVKTLIILQVFRKALKQKKLNLRFMLMKMFQNF